jgi:DNA-binding CsgD family transcriptional regulator
MRLLERGACLTSLVEYADEACRGDGRLVLVGGEAGIGKSALVERFQQDLPDARWSWGTCDGLFTPRPLGPLFDLADQLGGTLLELCQARADREELFRALLRQVSEPGTLDVVVVEDIHWADEATLDLLRYLSRRLREAPALLIATYRDDAVAVRGPLSVTLGDLATQRSVRRIKLAPLSMSAVRTLAAGSRLEPSELFRLTGGNPFFVSEVVQAGLGAVPVSAREAVLARTACLSSRAHEVLDVSALIGTRVQWKLLERITGCSPPTIDELLTCGLLAAEGDQVRFRHEIGRLAVEEAISPHHAGAIHTKILDALVSSGCDDDAQLAFHAEGAGDGAAVLRYAPAAARRAVELASHREAVVQFQRALRFSAGAQACVVAGLYDGLADEISLADRWHEAADACQRALVLWRETGDRLREGDTLRRLSRIMWNLCRDGEAVAAAEAAVAVLESLGPTAELGWAYATSATQRMLCTDYDAAAGLAMRAQKIAEQIGAMDVLSDALNTQAVCAAIEDREWTVLMNRALRIALSGGFAEQAARAYGNFCTVHGLRRELIEAERHLADGIAYCHEHDLKFYATLLRNERATILERTGRWDEALQLSMQVLAEVGTTSANRNRLFVLIRLGLIQARRGEPDAWGYLDEASAAVDAAPQHFMVSVRLARAEAHWLAGKLGEAAREAERADDLAGGCDAWTRGAVAVWLARTGSARVPSRDVAEPYRLELDGEWARAGQLWSKLRCPYDAAMALTGAPDEKTMQQALTIFNNLNALPAVHNLSEKLHRIDTRQLRSRPRAATRAHPFGLTRREREVLAGICAAQTNAQIATELGISTKTVEHHVTAILTKMGASNRTSAVRVAIQLEINEKS